ncbi:MAG: peptidylprolyl isomerase [Bacteroidota bacterium]
MGTMTRLRENTGVVLWILVIAFGVIWVLQDSGGLDFVGMAGGTNIILVDGEPITVEEYTSAVEAQVQRYQQQSGESMPPQMLERERDRVFDALVEDRLREREMNRLGIAVTDEEVFDMVLGEEPHPLIVAYFGDAEGQVDRALLQNFISDPEARQDWIQIEDFLRQERRREKLQNLIEATVRVTDAEVEEEYLRRNRSATVEWVGLRYADIPDSDIEVTDRDLRRYYDQNREDFRRERTSTLEYVTVSKLPSEEDSLAIQREMERLRPQFADAEDDSLFLVRNGSEQQYSDEWFGPAELEPDLASAVFESPEPGEVVGPVFAGGSVHLAKILDVRSGEPAIRARHILIRGTEESDDARQQLEEIRERVEGGASFAAMARQYSQDNTAAQGGDLGWFGRGRMVAPFEQAAFNASVGEIVGPVLTTFGYHLIQVTDRSSQEVRLADYAQTVSADIGTLNRIQERLEDLRFYVEEGAEFSQEAERLGMNVERVQVEAGQDVIPGSGQSRALSRFVERAEPDDISEVIELDEVFVVARVEEVQSEGYRSFEDVSDEIRPRVILNQKKDVQVRRLSEAAASADDLSSIASQVDAQIRTQNNVTFTSQVISGLGREPRFAGTAFGLSEGETSDVTEGRNAAFIIRVTDVEEPAPITAAEERRIRQQLENQRRTMVTNQWITALREEAEIRDFRARFLQN